MPIRVQVALNTSLKLFVKLLIKAFNENIRTNIPTTIEIAKPKEKTFSCGAAFVITPSVKLTTSMVHTAVNAMARPAVNIEPKKNKNSFSP